MNNISVEIRYALSLPNGIKIKSQHTIYKHNTEDKP